MGRKLTDDEIDALWEAHATLGDGTGEGDWCKEFRQFQIHLSTYRLPRRRAAPLNRAFGAYKGKRKKILAMPRISEDRRAELLREAADPVLERSADAIRALEARYN